MPLISVIMGCYNDERFIRESINSILYQTISDFEFIIIDDCSTDSTVDIIKSYKDNRIVLVENKENKGLGYNLYTGVNMSKGKYIARMDADDISLPLRFEKEVNFLKSNPDVLCVGTSSKKIGELSLRTKIFSRNINQESDYEMLKVQMLLGTPMMHPSIMFNAVLMRERHINYDPSFKRAQDYELWSRIIWDNKMSNLKERLLHYRYSLQQASSKSRTEQIKKSEVMYRRILFYILQRNITDEELRIHTLFSTCSSISNEELFEVRKWLEFLNNMILSNKTLDVKCFQSFIARRWSVICRDSVPLVKRIKIYNTLSFSSALTYTSFVKMMLR